MNQDGSLNFVHKKICTRPPGGRRADGLDVDVNDAVVAAAVVWLPSNLVVLVGLRLEVLQLKITKSV